MFSVLPIHSLIHIAPFGFYSVVSLYFYVFVKFGFIEPMRGWIETFVMSFVLIGVVGALMPSLVYALKISYNTTSELQFYGNDAFENLTTLRVIFRPEPINIKAGENLSLDFVIENPDETRHEVTVSLVEVPEEFTLTDGRTSIKTTVLPKTVEKVGFKLSSPPDIKARTYWYGFDVVDNELDEEESIINTEKRLGTYNGFNVVFLEEPVGDEINTKSRSNRIFIAFALIILMIFLYLVFKFITER